MAVVPLAAPGSRGPTWLLLVLLSSLLAGCTGSDDLSGSPATDAAAKEPAPAWLQAVCSATGVAHRANGTLLEEPLVGLSLPQGCALPTGSRAAEPTMGVTPDGVLFFQVFDYEKTVFERARVIRSTDGGQVWDDTSPRLTPTGLSRHPSSGDPVLWVDPDTGRLFTGDFIPPCHQVSWSDDLGMSWTTTVASCDIIDHQTLFTGAPTTSSPLGYDNIVYLCGPAGVDTRCVKSTDGGVTFVPTGAVAFPPRQGAGELLVLCNGGGHGHGHTAPDGAILLAKANYCGQPWLAMSDDEGASWTRVQVADIGSPWHEAEAAADEAGNLYYTWIANDLLPYLVVSTDGGATWSKPLMVGPPGLTEASQPGIDAGGEGKVAVTYLGSTGSPRQECGADCTAEDYANVSWNGYLTVSVDATNATPTFLTASVNDPQDPLLRGTCGQVRCGNLADFHDIVIGPDGTVWGAFADGCFDGSCAHPTNNGGTYARGLVGRLWGVPSLR